MLRVSRFDNVLAIFVPEIVLPENCPGEMLLSITKFPTPFSKFLFALSVAFLMSCRLYVVLRF